MMNKTNVAAKSLLAKLLATDPDFSTFVVRDTSDKRYESIQKLWMEKSLYGGSLLEPLNGVRTIKTPL